ncbi:MAG: hypothetical protein WDM80_04485 [Limisphaerales bacterium]
MSESKQAHIGVVLTPQLNMFSCGSRRPPTPASSRRKKLFDFKGVQVLEGGELKFRLQSNRPLREGWLEITAGDQPPQRIVLKKSADNEVAAPLSSRNQGGCALA